MASRLSNLAVLAAGGAALVLTSCVASWRWSWTYRVDLGSDADFRGVNTLCGIAAVDEIEGVDLSPMIREEIGFPDICFPVSDRHLELVFRYGRGVCPDCGPSVPSASGRVRVVGARGVEAEAALASRECGLSADEYARSYAASLRGLTLWGDDVLGSF